MTAPAAPTRSAPSEAMTPDAVHALVADLAGAARQALPVLARAPSAQKSAALEAAAQALGECKSDVLAANARDMDHAKRQGLSAALCDRLWLDEARIMGIMRGLRDVAALPDPVGRVLAAWSQPNGLHFERIAVPLGVIAVVYESRPNVTVDAAAIGLMAGNAVILRGGSEAQHSNRALMHALHAGVAAAGLPTHSVQLVPSQDRAVVGGLLAAHGLIDVIIPRGGKSLVARVQADARVPVFAHLDGNCHTYIEKSADVAMAQAVVLNAKMRRTGICGATETILFERAAVESHAGPVLHALLEAGCEVRVAPELRSVDPRLMPVDEEDWRTEYLDAIVAVGVVETVDAAIAHINHYGSHHTEAILTEDAAHAAQFLRDVDSAIVLHNASTQFADGGEFGFGAEIGISTGRIHARGPVGVEQLTTFKYVVRGSGTLRQP